MKNILLISYIIIATLQINKSQKVFEMGKTISEDLSEPTNLGKIDANELGASINKDTFKEDVIDSWESFSQSVKRYMDTKGREILKKREDDFYNALYRKKGYIGEAWNSFKENSKENAKNKASDILEDVSEKLNETAQNLKEEYKDEDSPKELKAEGAVKNMRSVPNAAEDSAGKKENAEAPESSDWNYNKILEQIVNLKGAREILKFLREIY